MINKKEYEQKIKLYKEICYLYPIFNFFENIHDKYIFDFNFDFSECIFYQILQINTKIPERNRLNITLDYLKRYSNIEAAYNIGLKGMLLMYQKYKILVPSFKKGSFLYN